MKGGEWDVKIYVIVVLLINMFWIIFQEIRIMKLHQVLHEVIEESIKIINKLRKEGKENE